jgi:hypothetical protein
MNDSTAESPPLKGAKGNGLVISENIGKRCRSRLMKSTDYVPATATSFGWPSGDSHELRHQAGASSEDAFADLG